jgi:hypothetical protein
MEDLVYVAIVIVFFALMLALVHACDRIIGSDEEALGSSAVRDAADAGDEDVEVAA